MLLQSSHHSKHVVALKSATSDCRASDAFVGASSPTTMTFTFPASVATTHRRLWPVFVVFACTLAVSTKCVGVRIGRSQLDSTSYLGLTNELADNNSNNQFLLHAANDSNALAAAAAAELNLTAFTALADPTLTEPFRDDLSTMWTALKFLCRVFHSRNLTGCPGILALPVPDTTSPSSAGDSTTSVGNITDVDGRQLLSPSSPPTPASSPQHAASLFRFLRAEPLGFSHMKVRVGRQEPLVDDATDTQFMLREVRTIPRTITPSKPLTRSC